MGKERSVLVSAGTLASLAHKKRKQLTPRSVSQPHVQQEPLASLPKRKRSQLSTLRSQEQFQVQREALRTSSPQSSRHTISTSPVEQELRRSTSFVAQEVQGQVPQTSLHSTLHTTEADPRETQQTLPTTQETNGQSENQGPSTGKKGRGSTQMQSVHGRSDRKLIVLNDRKQPIGPTKEVVSELSSFLGTIARNSALCPVSVIDWRKVPKKTKDDMWKYTREKYDIPDEGKDWVLDAIKLARRRYRFDLKNDFYIRHDSLDVQMQKRPKYVPDSDFKDLLVFWNSNKGQEMSEKNKENRTKLKHPHTAGKSSFAIIREEIRKVKSADPTRVELFVATRKRTPGRVYKESYEDTMRKIADMETVETQAREEGESVDAFSSVMGPEHPGRVRLYGRGVTKTFLRDKAGKSDPLVTNDSLEQRIEERVQEKFESQKDALRKDITMSIIEQLQILNPGLQLNLEMLRFNARSPENVVNNTQGVQVEDDNGSNEDFDEDN